MSHPLPESALKVQAALARLATPFHVTTMPETTRTAKDAARAIGCTIGQIAKSIVFRGTSTGKPVLVIASGANRVDEEAVARLAGEPIGRATPEFVRESTGFAIGGVPPVGFAQPIETWIDHDLLQYQEVWAAAGTPFAVFRLDPRALPVISGGTVAHVAVGLTRP
jgi:prolyl-tRNA editing enzyme YbaK/EbsC (Cys-tRNA(Pro) deacylase)